MKTLGVLAVVALLAAGVAVAQSTSDMGNMKTAGATFAEGVVDSSSSTSLSIKNEAGGRLTFLLDNHTVNAANHPAGSRVKINYHNNENGVAIADEIQGIGDKSAAATTSSTTSTSTTYTAAAKPAEPVVKTEAIAPVEPAPVTAPAPAPALDVTPAPAPVTAEPAPANLPKTASNLPALGLIGFAALAGFAALRSSR